MLSIDVVATLTFAKGKKFDLVRFKKFMEGQTISMLGDLELYYLPDVKRYIEQEAPEQLL